MKTRLSYKDFVLLIGIMVAVVIAITTWMYTDHHQPKTNIVRPIIKKETLNSATSMILGKLIKKASTADCIH